MLWRNNVNLLCNQMFYFYFNSTTNNTFVNKSYSDTSLLVACFLTNDHFCSLHSSPWKQHSEQIILKHCVYFSYKSYFYFRFHETHIYCWQYFRWRQHAALRLTLKLKGSIISKLIYFTKKSCLGSVWIWTEELVGISKTIANLHTIHCFVFCFV